MSLSLKKYIGDKAFYKMVLAVAVPVMIQNGITNFVSMLDNIMVGRLGTEAMSGVSIVNQFIFIFNLLIFGAVSAAGIFTAQYFGSKDNVGIRYTFRFKFLISLAASVVGVICFFFFDDALIGLFLMAEDPAGNASLTLEFGKKYLFVMLWGLIPYAISQVYSSTMRETGDAFTPMAASLAAVATNFIFNLILIFGYLGFPAMGVRGAALATVISRFVELAILVIKGHTNTERYPYLKSAFRSVYIPSSLFSKMVIKGLPLMLNEFLWAIAVMLRNQCLSTRGLDVVAAQNIQTTLLNVFNIVYLALGSSIAIVVGKHLGAGEIERAKDTDRKMIAFSVTCASAMALLFVAASFIYPSIYNTSKDVRELAAYLMIVSAFAMPFQAFANASYFTLRSGGMVSITFLFDSGFMWGVVLPVSFILAYLTPINIYLLFPLCQFTDAFKALFGALFLKKSNWARQLVVERQMDEAVM